MDLLKFSVPNTEGYDQSAVDVPIFYDGTLIGHVDGVTEETVSLVIWIRVSREYFVDSSRLAAIQINSSGSLTEGKRTYECKNQQDV